MIRAVENISSDLKLTHELVNLISDQLWRGIFYYDWLGNLNRQKLWTMTTKK